MTRNDTPEPCTEEAYEQGCTCRMSQVHSTDIDPPEPVVTRDCPLHGYEPDPDDALEQLREDRRDRLDRLIDDYGDS